MAAGTLRVGEIFASGLPVRLLFARHYNKNDISVERFRVTLFGICITVDPLISINLALDRRAQALSTGNYHPAETPHGKS